MPGDLTRRLYAAAEDGTTREEITRAVCRELAEFLSEEATLYGARLTSSRRGIRMPGEGDRAHMEVIEQMADLMTRVGDEKLPS
jgi:hypothetical protein